MGQDAAIAQIFTVTTGVWTIAGVLAIAVWRVWNGLPAVMAQWIAWRQARADERAAIAAAREAAKQADWDRLRTEVDRLAARVETLEEKVEECEADRHRWMGRAIEAEAKLLAQGEIRQAAAVASAEVRLEAHEQARKNGTP